MTTKKRSPAVARFEIVSNDHAAGEAYRHVVVVEKNGRVRSVVTCVGREETVQEWSGAKSPTVDDLACLLVNACWDDYHASRVRLLSAIVHGLLPQGNFLWNETSAIPDAALDASLGFGPRTTYRAEIRQAVAAAVRNKPEAAWALRLQTSTTDEHAEFVKQISEASTADPEWVARCMETSRSGVGTPFDKLVARVAQDDFVDK